MCRRLARRAARWLLLLTLYACAYWALWLALSPTPRVLFVPAASRAPARRALLFLATGAGARVFRDAEGADAFARRGCGGCFVTDNRGFLPAAEYDAVLVVGRRARLEDSVAAAEPGRRYLLDASARCLRRKLRCAREPAVTAFASRRSYTLCGLCRELLRDKLQNDRAR